MLLHAGHITISETCTMKFSKLMRLVKKKCTITWNSAPVRVGGPTLEKQYLKVLWALLFATPDLR